MNTNQSIYVRFNLLHKMFFSKTKKLHKRLWIWIVDEIWKSGFLYTISWYCVTKIFFSWWYNLMVLTISISWFEPGDSMWPFHPLVGGHLTIWKGHLTIPKRSLWITWNSNLHSIPIKNRTPEVLFAPNLLFWEFQCRIHVEMMIYVGGVLWKI